MVDPMNEKGGRVTTFERSSWTFAFYCFYVLLFIQVNLQLSEIKHYWYGEQIFRRKKVVERLHNLLRKRKPTTFARVIHHDFVNLRFHTCVNFSAQNSLMIAK